MSDASAELDEHFIVMSPGLPDYLSRPDDERNLYPSSALPFLKIARDAGYPVRLSTPTKVREVSHHSDDIWLPIVTFGLQVLAGGAGSVLADILMRVLPPRRQASTAHIRWNVQARDGSIHQFSFDGDRDAAVETARVFERSLGYGDDNS